MRRILISLIGGLSRLVDGAGNLLSKAASAMRMGMYLSLMHEKRDDDIWIVSYPKSGTTVTQMLTYQLCSGANTEFRHIEDVSPWFEICVANQPRLPGRLPSPRVLKTHMRPRLLPRNGRVIYVYRDPKDVAVSFYNQLAGIYDFDGDLEAFMQRFIAGKVPYGSWFQHVQAWAERSTEQPTLFLNYNELRTDLEGCARKIAEFCELDISEELIQASVHNAGFEQMKANHGKFDPRLVRRKNGEAAADASTDFIRSGKIGSGEKTLSPSMQSIIDSQVHTTLSQIRQVVPGENSGISL